MDSIERALRLSQQLHQNHKRLSGGSFFEHTKRTYEELVAHGIKDENTLTASLLHHALDFPGETEKEIEKAFGEDVLGIIKRYKKLSESHIGKGVTGTFNEKYIIQAYINLSEDLRTLVIRIADKLENLKHSWDLPKEQRIYIAERALYLYAPLAKITFLSGFSKDLENEAFKILNPREYFQLEKNIKSRSAQIYRTLEEIDTFLKSVLDEKGMSGFEITHRIKHLYSIYRKAKYYESIGINPGKKFENIHDLAGMRIIVNSIDECYMVETILKDLWDDIPEERDDYIEKPRSSGYQSIHGTYKIGRNLYAEVQIRTHEMNEKNEYGATSHLLYKIGDKGGESKATEEFKKYLKKNPFWFKELNFWEAEKTLSEYKPATPFSENIYTFTPKGDIIELPVGATPVDFAYSVHSKIGHSCVGSIVNGKISALDKALENGDLVEIKTIKSKNKPSTDWLNFVKTKKARDGIRKGLSK
ncbi:MAG: TGS domain-containing protein [Patescibacteria group bacterium]|jgi:GTP pyrophosphokinase